MLIVYHITNAFKCYLLLENMQKLLYTNIKISGGIQIMKNARLKSLEASDERQYMLHENYEVYEKHGAPTGAVTMHYHNFYEIIYVLEGEYASLLGNQTYHLKSGDFLLIDCNLMHKYQYIEKKHDSSKRIILWITQSMLEKLSDGAMDLTACFRENESCAYHFPIYYEEMLRGYLLKMAVSEVLDMEAAGAKEVIFAAIAAAQYI